MSAYTDSDTKPQYLKCKSVLDVYELPRINLKTPQVTSLPVTNIHGTCKSIHAL